MSFRRWEAKAALATLFFIHLFRRVFLFWKKPMGLSGFINQFSQDAIFPVSPNERDHFPTYQRCQACSLCTFSCEAIKLGRAPSAFEPKMILLGFGRSSHEAEFLYEEWLPCVECASCQVICPNGVPVHGMANQIIERRKRVQFRV